MWKILSSKEIFKHPRLTIIEDEVILPNGEKTDYIKYKDNGVSFTSIICQREDEKILVQKEYSHPSKQKIFQFPGGKIEKDEEISKGANRELMEESKLKANHLELLGNYLNQHRRSTAKVYVYLGTDLEKSSLEGGIEEEIENFWFSEKEIDTMIKNNDIIHVHFLAAWMYYKLKKIK